MRAKTALPHPSRSGAGEGRGGWREGRPESGGGISSREAADRRKAITSRPDVVQRDERAALEGRVP